MSKTYDIEDDSFERGWNACMDALRDYDGYGLVTDEMLEWLEEMKKEMAT